MSIYANARRDERIREYLPVKRILWQSGCSGAEIMPGNLDLQPRVAGPMSKIRIAKGGGILLDFGIELHGHHLSLGSRNLFETETKRVFVGVAEESGIAD